MKISLKECRQSVLSSSQPIPPAPTNRARVLLKSIVGRGMGCGGLDLVMRWMIKIVCGLNIVYLGHVSSKLSGVLDITNYFWAQ
jgi:hypothetical protein